MQKEIQLTDKTLLVVELPLTVLGLAKWRLRITKLSTQNENESEREPSINFSDRHIAKTMLYDVRE